MPPEILNCTGGNGVSQVRVPSGRYSVAGFAIILPESWTMRLNSTQWTWLDGQAAFGRSRNGSTYGVVVGRLNPALGIRDHIVAAEGYNSCLSSHGVFSDGYRTPVLVSITGFAVAGTPGIRRVTRFANTVPGEPDYLVDAIILQGQGGHGAFVGFYPEDDVVSRLEVEDAMATLRPA